MSKLSGLCISDEHAACPENLFDASGKRFNCTCSCHARIVPVKSKPSDWDYEDDTDD